jgi:hypothetical protein
VVLAAAALAVVLPWTARNYRVHGRLVLIATNGGSTFYGGNNDRVVSEVRQLGHWISTVELPHRDLVDAAPNEVSHDQVEWRLGCQWLREHPAAVPQLVACKLARLVFWLPDFDGGRRAYYLVRAAGYFPFLLLMLVGAFCCARRPALRTPPWLAVHGALLATAVAAVIFWGSPRFRDANLPLLMLYAAVGAEALRGVNHG